MAGGSWRPKRPPAYSAANGIHSCQPQSRGAATTNDARSRKFRIRGRHRTRGRGVVCGGQGEESNKGCLCCDKKDERNRQPGKCFDRSALKRRWKKRSSLGPACAGVAAESGKSGSLWFDNRYADTTKLACSVSWTNVA